MRIPAFAKTIRFTLSMWYTAFLILLGVLLIFGINLAMQQSSITIPRPWQGSTLFPRETLEVIRSDNLERLRNYSLIGIGGLVLLGAIGGYFLSGRMLKPVDRVSALAARISSSNLKERIEYQGPDDEMKRLADTFDNMLERLDSAFESQKQFIQDASHELRTPIAIAQTNIEVVEMEERATLKDYKRLVEVLKRSIERMSKLSDKLLLLTEQEQDQAKWSVVDMASLLEEAAAEFSANAKATGVSLELEPASEELLVRGDTLHLRQAIVNLIDNAIKYNRPGGMVKVSTQVKNSQLIIQVEDSGLGISKADQQRIFDRFYRVDKSRSRAQGGSGLGLAIVKKIAENHGGTVSVESTPDKGSAFRVSLPIYKPT